MKSAVELVSVVIPCYNSGTTISQTVASVKAQTWPNIEIVIVDDGSNDPLTIQVLDALDNVILLRQVNSGLPAARNSGFRAASGNFVLPLDADDWIDAETITVMIRALQSNGYSGYIYCDVCLEGEGNGILQKPYNYFQQLFINQIPYCLLIPKQIWESIGGYDETMCQGYEDWEFNIRLGWRGYHGIRVAQPLFHYRISSSGMLISKSNRLHGQLWSEIQSRHATIYRVNNLYRLWQTWRNKSSQYSLEIYLIWFCIHKILPVTIFSLLFKCLRERAHKSRMSLNF